MDSRSDKHRPPPLHSNTPLSFQDVSQTSCHLFFHNLAVDGRHLYPRLTVVPRGDQRQRRRSLHADLPQIQQHTLLSLFYNSSHIIRMFASDVTASLPLPQDIPKDPIDQERMGHIVCHVKRRRNKKLQPFPNEEAKRAQSFGYICSLD